MTTLAPVESEGGSPSGAKWFGLLLGPILAVAVYFLLPGAAEGAEGGSGLGHAARATAAVATLMATWWLTEAIPLQGTALIPIALFPLLGIMGIKAAAAPYASDVIYLFLGGMMLGAAMERWGLHRRIALRVVLLVGTRPASLVGGVMVATSVISMWVSNTATAVMMLPIGASIVQLVATGGKAEASPESRRFATCLMLAIAYAATIGGVTTLIGSPPNAVLAGFISRSMGEDLTFARWLMVGLPVMLVFLPLAWLVLTRVAFPVGRSEVPGAKELFRKALAEMGPMSRGERLVLVVFGGAALGWVLRGPLASLLGSITFPNGRRPELADAGIAMLATLLLFLLPVNVKKKEFLLDWKHASRLPWGVLLLFGGGLSLAEAMTTTGLDTAIGSLFGRLGGVHPIVVVLVISTIVVFLTEIGSNTAVATTFLPITYAAALTLNIDPMILMVPVAMGCSYAFMMPTGTPPNALVFASGHVTIRQMCRAGLMLNFLSITVITIATWLLVPLVFGGKE